MFQQFDPTGLADGRHLPAFEGTSSFGSARAAYFADGSFVICAQTMETPGNGDGIIGRMFDANGAPEGQAFKVNSTLAGNQGAPQIATLSDGSFVVAFRSEGLALGQRFDGAGNRLGGEFLIGTSTDFDIAAVRGGGFIVAYHADQNVFVRHFNSAGAAIGEPSKINDIPGSSYAISADELANGQVAVVWAAVPGGPAKIMGRILEADGAPAGPELEVSHSFGVSSPDVAGLDDGGFIVAYEANSSTRYSLAQRFASTGNRVGEEMQLSAGPHQAAPQVAGLTNGRFVATWIDDKPEWPETSSPVLSARAAGAIFGPRAIEGTAADDVISLTGDTAASLLGGHGADKLTGAEGGDHLAGGTGDDLLFGWAGDDILDGGAGADLIEGGEGIDIISFISSSQGVVVRLDLQESWDGVSVDSLSSIEGVLGSDWNDTIFSSGGADLINGGSGSDAASYASSARGVIVNLQAQVTWDGAASDRLTSIENAIGSRFNDRLWGDHGANVLDGGSGGADELLGFGGLDTVSYASSERSVIIDLQAQATWDGVEGDTLGSIENAIGSALADRLWGDQGANVLDGGDGADILEGGAGADLLTAGLGLDTVSFASSERSVIVNLQAQSTWDGVDSDTLSSIENAIGSRFNDRLWGDQGANVLDGGSGGADELFGNGGLDTVSYASSERSVIIDLQAQATWDGVDSDTLGSIENAIGSALADRLWGDQGANVLDSGSGGADELLGFGGLDTVSYASSERSVIIDLQAQATWDGVEGDTLGSIENAIGSALADTFFGSTGNNVFEGAGGADVFALGSTWGFDTIVDFTPGEDRVHFAAGTFTSFDDLMAHSSTAGGSTVIQLDASNTLTLGVSASLLTSADFVLV